MKKLLCVVFALVCVTAVFSGCESGNYISFQVTDAKNSEIPLNKYKTVDSLVRYYLESGKMRIVRHYAVTGKVTDLSFNQVTLSCPDYNYEIPGKYTITATERGSERSASLMITLMPEIEITEFSSRNQQEYFTQYSSQNFGINLFPNNASFRDMAFSFDENNENKLEISYSDSTTYVLYSNVTATGPGLCLTRKEAKKDDVVQVTATLLKGAKAGTILTFTVIMLS